MVHLPIPATSTPYHHRDAALPLYIQTQEALPLHLTNVRLKQGEEGREKSTSPDSKTTYPERLVPGAGGEAEICWQQRDTSWFLSKQKGSVKSSTSWILPCLPKAGTRMQPCPSLHLSAAEGPLGAHHFVNVGFYTGHFTQECHHHSWFTQPQPSSWQAPN